VRTGCCYQFLLLVLEVMVLEVMVLEVEVAMFFTAGCGTLSACD
jgi:hypothetical protein